MIDDLQAALKPFGMFVRGGFHIKDTDDLLDGAKTLLLVGNAGSEMFDVMQQDSLDDLHPMDSWTERKMTAVAKNLGVDVFFPFGGPPWHPFQQWARRAENLSQSPIQLMIHPEYGVWHGYRAAFVFKDLLDISSLEKPDINPCTGCAKPCRPACPVGAFSDDGYDVSGCAAFVQSPEGKDCREKGCLSRRACPIGTDYIYHPAHAAFHMEAFIKAR